MGDELPARLVDLLESKGWSRKATLMASERKGQVTLLVEGRDGVQRVLKYREPGLGPLSESSFYARHKATYLPDVQAVRDDHVVMSYHSGQRLRQRLKAGSLTGRARRELLHALVHPVEADAPLDPRLVRRALLRSLGRLFDAGPIDVPQPTVLRQHLRRQASRLFRVAVLPVIHRAAAEATRGSTTVYQHGDLHLNNVLVGSDGGIVIVDWEDAFPGVPICDWLYFWPQYLRLVGMDETFYEFRDTARAKWAPQLRIFDQLLPLFNWAVSRNPRFAADHLRDPSPSGTNS